jgi:hypothetical protein
MAPTRSLSLNFSNAGGVRTYLYHYAASSKSTSRIRGPKARSVAPEFILADKHLFGLALLNY